MPRSKRRPAAESAPAARPNVADFTRRVWAVVRRVPHGRVVSYGGVAAILGRPRAARAVGRALCALPDDSTVPWWRVINRNGEISIRCATHGAALQRALLEAEGVRFDGSGRTDWRRFGWNGDGVPRSLRLDEAGSTTRRTGRPATSSQQR